MVETLDIFVFLQIAVAVMLVVVLYHVLFITVDLRKILRRVDDITREVENVIMKPISMADHILEWLLESIESAKSTPKSKKTKKKKVAKKK